MKKPLCIGIILCMVITILTPFSTLKAEADTNTAVTPIAYTEPIRVGYYSAFDDMIVDIDSKNNKGYGYEVFAKISERSGLQFEFVPIADSMIEAVRSGYVDVGGFNTRSDERRELVHYSETAYTKTYIALMSPDMSIRYADAAAIDGKTVAVYDENIGVDVLDKFCEENNISVNYLYGETETYMEQEADLFITYSEDPSSHDLNNILNLGVYNLYLITNLENTELMDMINEVYLEVIYTEGNFFMELEEKYLSDNIEISHRGLTIRETEILNRRPLEVGYVTGFSPISYTNDAGQADGVMVDVLQKYADYYGFEVNYHPYSIADTQDSYKDFDILLTLYGNESGEYENYSFSEPFYEIPLYAVINNNILDTTASHEIFMSNVKIASLPYQTVDFDDYLDVAPSIEFVFYTDWHELLDSFAAGETDMLICTESAVTYTQIYLDDLFTSTIHTDTTVPMQFLINDDIADEYVPIFNVMADKFSEQEYREIIETNANDALPSNETGFWEFLIHNWYYFGMVVAITIAAFIALYYREQIGKREALIQSYNTDPLTGLTAIQRFREAVEEKLEDAKPGEYEMISFDINMFKTINTHFSTDRGTSVIVAVAEALKKALENTSAIVSRRTGDQFLIFRRVDDGGEIRLLYGNYILPAIEDTISQKYKISMAFGNVIANDVKVKATSLIGQADNARVASKNTHNTTFTTFDDNMRKKYENKINITFRMEQALKEREFSVEYQPKIDFSTLKVGGAEALVRWTPRLGEKIYPDEFIPVFEENGFISYLDMYVLEEVCKFIKENDRKMQIPRISVNLSAHTILADNIIPRVNNILEKYGINPEEIELEITESAVERNVEQFLAVVKMFKASGFAISIDDFGAGVSSLNRLSAIEADVLKLDKAFFDLKGQGAKSTVVVTDVVNMAKHLNMQVVAEGVETAAQAIWLRDIGCEYAQGYYFARPMNENDFREVLTLKKIYTINLL